MYSGKANFILTDSSTDELEMSKTASTTDSTSDDTKNDEKPEKAHDKPYGKPYAKGNSKQYSADISPLKFKMCRPGTSNEGELGVVSNSVTKGDTEKLGIEMLGTDSPLVADKYLQSSFLGSINREQFEKYLKEPEYVRIFKKKRNIKQFRRMFLAQELRFENDLSVGAALGVPPSANVGASNASTTTLNSMGESIGRALWAMKFSRDGKFMATAGKDCTLRIWKVISSPMERAELSTVSTKLQNKQTPLYGSPEELNPKPGEVRDEYLDLYAPVFHPLPYRTFASHTQDILDLDWSKNDFILTASMDKDVRLWHCDRPTSLKKFPHPDFVTSVRFHPSDDRFFLSGCLDHTCRLWSILENRVAFEYYCGDLITALDVSCVDGRYTAVGTFNGYVSILTTHGLDVVSSFHVLDKAKGSGAKRATEHGPKITGLEFFKSDADGSLKLMVTSNDSSIRIFSIKDLKLLEVLRGFENASSQISAHLLKPRGNTEIVIAPSENHWVYCWKLRSTSEDGIKKPSSSNKSNVKRSGSLRGLLGRRLSLSSVHSGEKRHSKLFGHGKHEQQDNEGHQKVNSDHAIKNFAYIAFHAHKVPVTVTAVASSGTAKTLALSNDFICELTMAFSESEDDVAVMRAAKEHKNKNQKGQNSAKKGLIEARMPSMRDAIGTILVSSDTSGVIRVFRTDLSSNVRKRVLKALENKSTLGSYLLESLVHLDPLLPNGVLGNTVRAATNTLAKSRAFNSTTSIRSLGSLSSLSENKKMDIPSECDICGGTALVPGRPRRDNGKPIIYCSDCGNQVNRFR
ncbi:LAMI_0G04698g1_1 [Lachancea mirantina]|uniref:LAMI_0G04698g1_1 n=1 Tax=Lachancea mirantina TaxID=1230905 RepID=A0A1G4K8L0_9SACH|nr:LAMI_0G04698g1_1 [Lachancea mirantina]